MHIEPKHLAIVEAILKKYPYTFYAFGSRITGTPRRFSDLDLCFLEKIPWNIRSHIDEDFELSDLPYMVDVIDWNMCDKEFQTLIKKDLLMIQQGPSSSSIINDG